MGKKTKVCAGCTTLISKGKFCGGCSPSRSIVISELSSFELQVIEGISLGQTSKELSQKLSIERIKLDNIINKLCIVLGINKGGNRRVALTLAYLEYAAEKKRLGSFAA